MSSILLVGFGQPLHEAMAQSIIPAIASLNDAERDRLNQPAVCSTSQKIQKDLYEFFSHQEINRLKLNL